MRGCWVHSGPAVQRTVMVPPGALKQVMGSTAGTGSLFVFSSGVPIGRWLVRGDGFVLSVPL